MARRAPTPLRFGSCTDIGHVRVHNEDSLVAASPLFVVADGMGGHAAGEVASEIAVSVLADRAPRHADADGLGKAVVAANHAIIRAAREGRGREGMGTTCTAALLEGERLVIAQVGDSRAYLLHHGRLQQITRDHSLMADMIEAGRITPEEARTHPQRSVITRALGSDPYTEPDLYEINVTAGDRLLLCSDGLSGMVRNDNIERILSRENDPQLCADRLVDAALAAGGHDNVTVIVVDVSGFAEVRRKKAVRKTNLTVALVLVLLAAVLGGAAWGFGAWVDHSAYLAESDGKVAVYRGIPGNLFGKEFSQLEYVTSIDVDDLQPGTANRLRGEGIRVDNLKAADALVETYAMDLGTTFSEVTAPTNGGAGAAEGNASGNAAEAPADEGAAEGGDAS